MGIFLTFGAPLQFGLQVSDDVDLVLVADCNYDGSDHLKLARPGLEKGVATFVDKPFACSSAEAREMVRLAKEHNAPLFSCSSLRYAESVAQFPERREQTGAILGCDIYCPASTHPRNPGLFHYGIHGVEPLYTLMGPGCESVTRVHADGADVFDLVDTKARYLRLQITGPQVTDAFDGIGMGENPPKELRTWPGSVKNACACRMTPGLNR